MSAPPPPPSATKPIKRVVTGHDKAGKSTVLFADEPGFVAHNPLNNVTRIWVTNESPADNSDQTKDMKSTIPERLRLVQPNGTHVAEVEMGPGATSPKHRTSSVDYVILISGSLTILLEDGSEQTLTEPGSIVVQRGTAHTWANRTDGWTKFAVVLVDAKPVEAENSEGKLEPLSESYSL